MRRHLIIANVFCLNGSCCCLQRMGRREKISVRMRKGGVVIVFGDRECVCSSHDYTVRE